MTEITDSDSFETDLDEASWIYEESLFEKPQGSIRTKGINQEKKRIYRSLKDVSYIEKTVKSAGPISKKINDRIEKSAVDGLNLNVMYSMNKKNRFNDSQTLSLLQGAPEDLESEVVERNLLNKTCFAVHSKLSNDADESGLFDIRSAKSSGKGQHYSNFLKENRELSKKRGSREFELEQLQPIVSYNVYKAHPSIEAFGNKMLNKKPVIKSGRHRRNTKFDDNFDDYEDYDDEDDASENENSEWYYSEKIVNWADFDIKIRSRQTPRNADNESEISIEVLDFEECQSAPRSEFKSLFNVHDYLRHEGFTFINFDIVFSDPKCDFEEQIEELRKREELKITKLRSHQYAIDISAWCCLDSAQKSREPIAVVVLTKLETGNMYNITINSTITSSPSHREPKFWKDLLSSSHCLLEVINNISVRISTNYKIIETMKLTSDFFGKDSYSNMRHSELEWANAMTIMKWPNQNYHKTWANSEELSNAATRHEWKDLCNLTGTLKELELVQLENYNSKCTQCGKKKKSVELFSLKKKSEVECTDCLRKQFYTEMTAKRFPIDLNISDGFEHLYNFIPLPVLNEYVRIYAKSIYAVSEGFEKCSFCNSLIYFDDESNNKSNLNRLCPCGSSWCKCCRKEPHWPMNCQMYAEWKEKWLLRYSLFHADGSGARNLIQVTCRCEKTISNVVTDGDKFFCSGCQMQDSFVWPFRWGDQAIDWEALGRDYKLFQVRNGKIKQLCYYHREVKDFYRNRWDRRNQFLIFTTIDKIPSIRKNVQELCGLARDIRYNADIQDRVTHRENVLVGKKIIKRGIIQNLLSTATYLVENVSAWMNSTDNLDRKMEKNLKIIIEDHKKLRDLLNGEEKEAINKCIDRLRNRIDEVKEAMEKMLDTLKE